MMLRWWHLRSRFEKQRFIILVTCVPVIIMMAVMCRDLNRLQTGAQSLSTHCDKALESVVRAHVEAILLHAALKDLANDWQDDDIRIETHEINRSHIGHW